MVLRMTVALAGTTVGASLLAACAPTPQAAAPTAAKPAATTAPTTAPAATTAAAAKPTVATQPTAPAAQPTTATTAQTAGAKTGGTLVSMLVAEPTSMDIASGSGQHNYALMSNVFENLLEWDDKTIDVKPALALSFDVSPDGTAYTFKLRQGVKFHDGTDMDADAVAFSYSRVLDPDNEFYKLGQPFPLMDFWYGAIDPKQIVVQDKYTVTLKLKQPFSPLEGYLAWPAAAIVSPTAVKKYGASFRENPVGTGPFKFVEWQHNQKVTLARFDNYWGDKTYLDGVVFRPIIEEQTRLTELLAGNIDLAYDLPPDNVDQVKKDARVQYLETPLGHVWFLVLNTNAGPTRDVRVRQAMAYAIDKNAIINDILKGTGVPATGPVPSVLDYAYKKDVTTYGYDPDKAKSLLNAAGLGNGFSTKFWVTQSGSGMQSPKAMGEAIQAMLGQVGVNLTIEVMEWGAYLDKYAQGMPDDVSVAQMSWFTNDAQNIAKLTLTCDTVSPKGYNAGKYCNDQYDQALNQFYGTLDKTAQAKAMYQVQDFVASEVPNIYIDSQIANAALSKKYAGFSLHPTQLLRYRKTHLS
jgi:peptide/nickel transport system substrate-binding protein